MKKVAHVVFCALRVGVLLAFIGCLFTGPSSGQYILQSKRNVVGVDSLTMEDAIQRCMAFSINAGKLTITGDTIKVKVLVLEPAVWDTSIHASYLRNMFHGGALVALRNIHYHPKANPGADSSVADSKNCYRSKKYRPEEMGEFDVYNPEPSPPMVYSKNCYRPEGESKVVEFNVYDPEVDLPVEAVDVVFDPYIRRAGDSSYQVGGWIWCSAGTGRINVGGIIFRECENPLALEELERAITPMAWRLPEILGNVVLNNATDGPKREPALGYYMEIEEPVVVPTIEQSTPTTAK